MRKAATPWDSRGNNLDAIRLTLAVLVIFSHSYPLGTGSEALEPLHRLTRGQATLGSVAVDLFFILSGFLITASVERSSSIRAYFRKRIARIYPGFTAASLAGIFLFAVAGGAHLIAAPLPRAADFVLQTLRLREFTYAGAFASNPYPGSINGSTWSIQYEFWCYVGVAGLFAAGLLQRRRWIAGLFAGSLAINLVFATTGWALGGGWLGTLLGSPQLWARLLPCYLAGVVFYSFRDRVPHSAALAACAVLLLAAAAAVNNAWAVAFPLAGTYLVFYAAYHPQLRLHNFARFGDFSYGTYLYAYPIQQMMVRQFGHSVTPALLFLVSAPFALGAAVLSWYAVERRFLRPGRRKMKPAAVLEAVAG